MESEKGRILRYALEKYIVSDTNISANYRRDARILQFDLFDTTDIAKYNIHFLIMMLYALELFQRSGDASGSDRELCQVMIDEINQLVDRDN